MQKGSISLRKDGRYMGRFRSVSDNRVICVYAKTKYECAYKLKEAIENDKKVNIIGYSDNQWTLGGWLKYWLEKYEKPKLKESSFIQKYNIINSKVITNKLASKNLSAFKESDAISLLEKIDSLHMKVIIHRNLNNAFDIALKCGYIKLNPFAIIYQEKYLSKTKENTEALTREQEKKLLDYLKVKDTKMYYVCKFILNTGLRRGELVALTWNDVDFANKTITINKSSSCGKITTTKTENSNRVIPITSVVENLLKELYDGKKGNRVFSFTESHLTNSFSRVCSNIGMKGQRLHNLRHTYATRLYEAGVDLKVIQKLLGHKSHQTTIDIYVNTDTNYILKQLEKVDTQL